MYVLLFKVFLCAIVACFNAVLTGNNQSSLGERHQHVHFCAFYSM